MRFVGISRSSEVRQLGKSDMALLRDALHDQAMLQRLEVLLPPHGKELLNRISLNDSPDKLIWLGNTTGDFSAKDLRRKLTTPSRLDNVLARIWHPWLPPKISTIIWRLRHNAIATDDRVQSCGIHIVSKCRCCPFPARESSAHLFVHSHSADEVWKLGKHIFTFKFRAQCISCGPTGSAARSKPS
ncbi:hypothetical protein QQ045_032789 [Rhodiola kirilowii]